MREMRGKAATSKRKLDIALMSRLDTSFAKAKLNASYFCVMGAFDLLALARRTAYYAFGSGAYSLDRG